NEETRDGNRFRDWSAAAFAQVQNHFVYALFFSLQQAGPHFFGAAWVERGEAQHKNVWFNLLNDEFRGPELFTHKLDFVWGARFAAPDYGDFNSCTWLAV